MSFLRAKKFNSEKIGIYGEFGTGANARVRYLQTVFQPLDLKDISLVSSIRGSEKWDVVDLFQRNVDNERVEKDIIPYLKNNNQIKFFNPLTLILLPIDNDSNEIIKELPSLNSYSGLSDDEIDSWHEFNDYYRIGIKDSYGQIEWNSAKCHIVAIDGQHRLSAMKRIVSDPNVDSSILNWSIPVVILVIEKVKPDMETATLLQLVRNTFVYINTQAVRVNSSREILLNDESPTAICTQEFVQSLHSNDNRDLSLRDNKKLPLLLVDWRGDTHRGKLVKTPASIFSVEEINNWLKAYIVGDDFTPEQKNTLEISEIRPVLESYISSKVPLNSFDAKKIRKQFRTIVLPGFEYLLENIDPYKKYIESIRNLEKEQNDETDISAHAFVKLRFGTHDALDSIKGDVEELYADIVNDIEHKKNTILPILLHRDIGIRSIMYSFSNLMQKVNKYLLERGDNRLSFLEYAKIYIPALNKIFKDGLFDIQVGSQSEDIKEYCYKFTSNVLFGSTGNIIKYKVDEVKDGFGSLLTLFIARYLVFENDHLSSEFMFGLWSDEVENIKKIVSSESKKIHRATEKSTFKGTPDEFNHHIAELANNTSSEYIDDLADFLDIVQ